MPPKKGHPKKQSTLSVNNASSEPRGTRRSARLMKATTKPDLASKLPFDILFQIFEEYLHEETVFYPVETLPAVCRSWSQAALDHLRLWSTFVVQCGDFWFWNWCIPRRLARSRPGSLLDIDVDMMGDSVWDGIRYGGNEADFELYQEVLFSYLAGPHGEYASRWRKFGVTCDVPTRYDGEECKFAKSLAFPTPNLEELTLEGIFSTHPVFPSTPSLKIFLAYDIGIPNSIDLTASVDVCIDTGGDLEALARALNLVHLNIYSFKFQHYQLHSRHLCLTSLHLPQGLGDDALVGFAAPVLKSLTVVFARGSEFRNFVACEGIPMGKLESILIEQAGDIRDSTVKDYCEGLQTLLHAATHIKLLQLDGKAPVALVLKLLTSHCESLYRDHEVLLQVGGYEIELGRGEDRIQNISELRGCMEYIVDGTWEEIYESLSVWLW